MQHWLLAGGEVVFVWLVEGENGVLRAEWQAEPGCRGAAPPWGTVLPGPGGVPRRGKGRTVPHGGRVSMKPHSSRGRSKEGGHLLPRRHPSQALSRSVVQVRVNLLQCPLADAGERRLLGMEPADQPVGVLVRAALPGVVGIGEEELRRIEMFLNDRPRKCLGWMTPREKMAVFLGYAP